MFASAFTTRSTTSESSSSIILASGGEQQRVAIARALINNPKLILADEPTGNLDSNTAEEVFELFLDRAENSGTAIIMVTHNISLAKRMHKTYKLDYTLEIM